MTSSPASAFKIECNGKTFWLGTGSYTIGRSSLCNILVDDAQSSRYHARLTVALGAELEDLGSANGTLVNGIRMPRGGRCVLNEGDRVIIGTTELVLSTGEPPLRPSSAPAPPRSYSGLMRAVSDERTGATSRADPLELIGEVADRALRTGHVADAISLLEAEIARVASEARAGRATPAQVDWGVDRALQLAEATGDGQWFDRAVGLLLLSRCPPSSDAQLSALERAVERVTSIGARAFHDYVDAIQREAPLLAGDAADRYRRMEGLVGKVSTKVR